MFERILPGAFDRAIAEDDVFALFSHQESNVLGRTKAGTCTLRIDEVGLFYEATLPDTQQARDVKTLIDRGEITGSSFAFDIADEQWKSERQDGRVIQVREVLKVSPLYDVGPVTFPAYQATTAEARRLPAMASRDAPRLGVLIRHEVDKCLALSRQILLDR